MRSLVTGATGFLGSAVARLLEEAGDEVVALVRPTSDRGRLARTRVEYVEADVTDRPSVERAVARVDRVLHCAASVELGSPDQDRMWSINVTGTAHVLGAAVEQGLPAVHVSSASALGPTGDRVRDETWWNPAEPEVAYERTKREAHLVARRLVAEGADVRIAIPGGVYGPGDDSELGMAIRWYQRFSIPIGYVAGVRHSPVHVSDAADAIVRLADRGSAGDEYLVCAQAVTMREWFATIAQAAHRRPPRWYLSEEGVERLVGAGTRVAHLIGARADRLAGQLEDTAHMLTRSLGFSGDRARRELGWRPRPLLTGMRELAETQLSPRR